MNSCLFIGRVRHTRYLPVTHRLDYPIYLFGIALEELELLDRNLILFGYNHLRPLSIYDRDYLDASSMTIREKLMNLLREKTFAGKIARITLITSPRYLHYVFNPVSFYYCYGTDDSLLCTVAEVNNTFGERHLYIPDAAEEEQSAYPQRFRTPKAFHVSPFNDLEGTYEFLFGDIRHELDIRINLQRDGQTAFTAELEGRAIPLENRNLLRTLLHHPIIPTLTMTRIYREAAKLYFLRKLPYHGKPIPLSMMTIRKRPPTPFQRVCRRFTLDYLRRLEHGHIRLTLPEGTRIDFGAKTAGESADMVIHDHAFFARVALRGDIGLGESYTDGEWDSSDPPLLFKLLFKNRDRLSDGNFWTDTFLRVIDLAAHRQRPNTLRGSSRNISDHYDLSNELYSLFLDSSLTYSCALYESENDTLETAQRNKFLHVIRKARIGQADHVLEIGCGWGSFAVEAARSTGCHITGLTVSQAQYDFAREKIRRQGMEDQIDIRLADYRSVEGQYDRIVSIEMVEAVGHRYLPAFFHRCEQLLKPGGIMLLQAITVPDNRYEAYRRGTDWIRKHIFPGGNLPSLAVIREIVSARTSLVIEEIDEIGLHYARTLREWRRNFNAHLFEISRLGFGRSFQRKWNYYLACCEGGFAARELGDAQIILLKK